MAFKTSPLREKVKIIHSEGIKCLLSQLDVKSKSQCFWGAVVQARLSQALDVLEPRAASLLLGHAAWPLLSPF